MVDLDKIFGGIRTIGTSLFDRIIDGAVMVLLKYLHQKIVEWDSYYTSVVVNLEQLEEPVFYGVVGGASMFFKGKFEYLDYFEVAIDLAIFVLGETYVIKKPYGVLKDNKTIKVYNLDGNADITVIVDGSSVSFSTTPKTDSNGNATITLPSTLSSGEHKILVHTNFKAVFFKGYVK